MNYNLHKLNNYIVIENNFVVFMKKFIINIDIQLIDEIRKSKKL